MLMQTLDRMQQGRPVALLHGNFPNLNYKVGTYADEEPVKGGVVKRTK